MPELEAARIESYLDLGRETGISRYECGEGFIRIVFRGGATYVWDTRRISLERFRQMHLLASRGDGLSEFINRHVKQLFLRRER